MKKLISIEITKMRYYWVIWGIVIFAVGDSIAMALNSSYEDAVIRYPAAEYNVFLFATGRMFFIITIMSTAYVINEDFSMRTVQNVFSVGVNVVKYFFSRLFSQMLFIFALYTFSCVSYISARILSRGFNSQIMWRDFLLAFFVLVLQLMAYVSIANMISMFCRSQAIAMVVGEVCLFLSVVCRAYYEEGILFFRFIIYEPMAILETVSSDFISVSELPKYVVSAITIMIVTSVIGYVRFMRSDIR